MTGHDTTIRSVVIWICEGTWQASVDAALHLARAGSRFTLLHVTSQAPADAVRGAYRGLLGRAGPDPGDRLDALATAAAAELVDAAARGSARTATGWNFTVRQNGPWWQRPTERTCSSWRETETGPGSARKASVRPPGLSWITPPARCFLSGRKPRLAREPFPRRHITLTMAAARRGNPDRRGDGL